MTTEATKPAWEQRVRDMEASVEEELRRVIQYVNDEIVPDVRRDGSVALRAAAAKLQRLAEWMDAHPQPTASGETKAGPGH